MRVSSKTGAEVIEPPTIDFAMPVLEVVDSRYGDSRLDLRSVIVDNAPSARFVVGACRRDAADPELKTLGVLDDGSREATCTVKERA